MEARGWGLLVSGASQTERLRAVLAADEIDLELLRTLVRKYGIPEESGLRSVVWKLLVGFLPAKKSKWLKTLRAKREEYSRFASEFDPTASRPGAAAPVVGLGALAEGGRGAGAADGRAGGGHGAGAADGRAGGGRGGGDLVAAGVASDPLTALGGRGAGSGGFLGGGGAEGGPAGDEKVAASSLSAPLSSSPSSSSSSRLGSAAASGSLHPLAPFSGSPPSDEPLPSEVAAEHPLSLDASSAWRGYFADAEQRRQIERDVLRTHPDLGFFGGDADAARAHREAMGRILFAYAKLNRGVGYVQGMNELLAPFLFVFGTAGPTAAEGGAAAAGRGARASSGREGASTGSNANASSGREGASAGSNASASRPGTAAPPTPPPAAAPLSSLRSLFGAPSGQLSAALSQASAAIASSALAQASGALHVLGERVHQHIGGAGAAGSAAVAAADGASRPPGRSPPGSFSGRAAAARGGGDGAASSGASSSSAASSAHPLQGHLVAPRPGAPAGRGAAEAPLVPGAPRAGGLAAFGPSPPSFLDPLLFQAACSPSFYEADSFWCLTSLLAELRDSYCAALDDSATGSRATAERVLRSLERVDAPAAAHLAALRIDPRLFAFRWITLAFTQEMPLPDALRLWDGAVIPERGGERLDALVRVAVAMLLAIRDQLVEGDFATCMRLLQNYPNVDVATILHIAQQLRQT